MEKRIVIFYITHLSGHHKAAEALEKSLKILDKDCRVFSYDALGLLHPYSSPIINSLYSFTIRKYPFLWRKIYDKDNVLRGLNPFKKFLHFYNLGKIERLVREIKPHAFICTQAFPCGVVSAYKRKRDGNFLLVGAVTDFWPNGFWLYNNIDYYTIASDWCRKRFEDAGIGGEKLKVFGIPIMPDFSEDFKREEAASHFGLASDLPTVLVMGGGSGLGPIEKVVRCLDESFLDFQVVVLCGKNKKLYRWSAQHKFSKKIRFFPYVDEVYRLMSFSDIIVTKSGGITVSEALSKKLALVVLNPIPGQEENNLKFLLQEGLALKAEDPWRVKLMVEDLLSNRDKLEKIKLRSKSFAHPISSLDIARLVLDHIKLYD